MRDPNGKRDPFRFEAIFGVEKRLPARCYERNGYHVDHGSKVLMLVQLLFDLLNLSQACICCYSSLIILTSSLSVWLFAVTVCDFAFFAASLVFPQEIHGPPPGWTFQHCAFVATWCVSHYSFLYSRIPTYSNHIRPLLIERSLTEQPLLYYKDFNHLWYLQVRMGYSTHHCTPGTCLAWGCPSVSQPKGDRVDSEGFLKHFTRGRSEEMVYNMFILFLEET